MNPTNQCECGSYNLRVTDSRPKNGLICRTRICNECGTRFRTIEIRNSDFYNLSQYKEIIMHIKAIETIMEDKQKCEITEKKT